MRPFELVMTSLVCAIIGVACPSPARGQASSDAARTVSPTDTYYLRVAATVEPDGTGRPERLPLYLQFFSREMINDTRLFPFDVDAEWNADEQIVNLNGFVGFEENRTALLAFLRQLGFSKLDDQIEVLPAADLDKQWFALVTASHSLIYDQPSGEREVLTDCLLGTPVFLLQNSADGHYLCQGAEGYVGYVQGADLRRVDAEEFARYQSGIQLRARHDVRRAEQFIPVGARLKFVDRQGTDVIVELPDGKQTSIAARDCEILDGEPNDRIDRVIENATHLMGTKYLWGGNTSQGIDCSGLMQTSFAAEGIHLPRDSNQQIYLGSLTATRWYRDGLRRGDTLFFLGKYGKISHTAIFLGDDRYLEAVRPVVRVTSFDPSDSAYNADRAAAFCFAKRLLQ